MASVEKRSDLVIGFGRWDIALGRYLPTLSKTEFAKEFIRWKIEGHFFSFLLLKR